MSKHFSCVVGVPSGQYWNAQFAVDLINMISAFPNTRVPGFNSQELRVVNVRSSILSKNRLDIVKAARAAKAAYILFLDTDHTFPKDLIQRLASHGRRVVAANCVTKTIPASPTARAKSEDLRGVPVYSDPQDTGLQEIWRIGTGVMLVKTSIFEEIGMGVWDMKYLAHSDTYQGEDWSFCEACEKAGIPLYIDHDVSKVVGHVGNYEFTHDVVGTVG